mmetsp:Transcript_3724/g.4380  ORF Transcript_3724/g.4380 Transcript_3724/m.4380 type:complete len:218 (-) Transcript_3724:134-787(-)
MREINKNTNAFFRLCFNFGLIQLFISFFSTMWRSEYQDQSGQCAFSRLCFNIGLIQLFISFFSTMWRSEYQDQSGQWYAPAEGIINHVTLMFQIVYAISARLICRLGEKTQRLSIFLYCFGSWLIEASIYSLFSMYLSCASPWESVSLILSISVPNFSLSDLFPWVCVNDLNVDIRIGFRPVRLFLVVATNIYAYADRWMDRLRLWVVFSSNLISCT